MALTKTNTLLVDWTVTNGGSVAELAVLDVSGHYATTLHIQQALIEATAHDGTKYSIETSSNSSGDEDWTELFEFTGITGTSNTEPITNAPAAIGTTVLTCANTTGYEENGKWRFIYESGTPADSEIFQGAAYSSNTSVTALDGTTRAHVATTPMWSIAQTHTIDLDITRTIQRIRIVCRNDLANAANCITRIRSSQVTGL